MRPISRKKHRALAKELNDNMEFLLALGLIVALCGGTHFFMMRGMHGGHGTQAGFRDHKGLGTEDSPDGVAELETQVARLQRELEASRGRDQRRVSSSSSPDPVKREDSRV